MYRQFETLASGEAMTLGGVYRKDMLQKVGQLSALLLTFEGPTVSGAFAGGGKWRIIDYITNIELLLNSKPTGFALPARAAQAVVGYHLGQMPVSAWRNYATNTQRDQIVVPFGRDLNDRRRYIDLGRYDSLQIRITNNATASLFGSLSVTIQAIWLRENTAPSQGFILRELFREYVPVAGGTEAVILPTELPICGIYVQGDPGLDANGRVYTTPHNLIYPLRFAMRSRQVDLFRDNIAMLNYFSNLLWGEVPLTGGAVYMSAAKEADIGLAHPLQVVAGAGSKTGAAATVIPTVEGDENNPSQSFISAQADVMYPFLARGTGFHNVFPVFLDLTPELSETIDPTKDGAVTLDITTRSTATITGAYNRVILERLASV